MTDASFDKRNSPREPAKIPVVVEGRDVNMNPVNEVSYTLLVNETGALLPLAAAFRINDQGRITNKTTGKKANFRIAWRSAEPLDGRWSYGIALIDATEDFWSTGQ